MKILFIFLFYFTLINSSLTFQEKRQKLLDCIYNYFDKIKISNDTTMKKYIKEQNIETGVYIRTLNIKEISGLQMPYLAGRLINAIPYTSEPITINEINPRTFSLSTDYFHVYGAAMNDGSLIYYIIISVKISTSYINGIEEKKNVKCENILNIKNCKTNIEYVPKGIQEVDLLKLEKY